MSFPEMRMGLAEPETAAECEARATINGMRQAILRGQRDSALINSCLRQAEYAGMSGEDLYVLLAYHALIALEKTHQNLSKWVSLTPNPTPVLIRPAEGKSPSLGKDD